MCGTRGAGDSERSENIPGPRSERGRMARPESPQSVSVVSATTTANVEWERQRMVSPLGRNALAALQPGGAAMRGVGGGIPRTREEAKEPLAGVALRPWQTRSQGRTGGAGASRPAPWQGEGQNEIRRKLRRHPASLHVLQANALSCTKTLPGLFDARAEACVILEPVVEPVVLRREPDEDTCRLPVAGDDHLPVLGFPQLPGEVVRDLREGNLLHSGFPNRASHDSASDFAMIASTSTVSLVTS